MRPEFIRMRAFGPYLGEAEVDFSPLWKAQIFLITGPTGGGKTSILDAMSFALYGQATGEAREFRDMRCTAADENEDTLTEFIFSLGTARYRFLRTIHLHKRRDGGRELQIGGECHVEEDGQWRLLASGSSAVTKKAEEILGFTHDQFSQVVVLPQGEFRRLLLANSSEKAKILEVLFATSIWQRTAEQLTYKLKALRGNLAELEQGEALLLESAGADDFAALEEMLAAGAQALTEARAAVQAAEKRNQAALAAFEAGQTLSADFAALAAAEKRQAALDGRAEENRAAKEKLETARRAAAVLPYDAAWRQSERLLRVKREGAEAAAARQKAAEAARQKAAERAAGIPAAEQTARDLQAEIAKYRALLPDAEKLDGVLREAKAAHKTAAEKKALLDRCLADYKVLEERIAKGEQMVEASYTAFRAAEREALINQFAAGAAACLQEGEPCPVCGSVHHPAPARPVEGGGQSAEAAGAAYEKQKALLEKLKAEREALRQKGERLRADFSGADRALAAAEATAKELTARLASAESYTVLQKKLREDEAAADRVAKEIAAVRKAAEEAGAVLAAAGAEREAASKALGEAEEQAADARRAAENAALTAGFAVDADFAALALDKAEIAALEKSTADYAEAVRSTAQETAALRARLEGKTAPDLAALMAEREAATAAFAEKSAACGRLAERQELLSSTRSKIAGMRESSAALREEYGRVCRVSELVSGRNRSKTPLHNFVLGLMLDDVILAASRYLGRLSRGRYCLVRAEEAGAGKGWSGLEIEVTDAHIGGRRRVSTLSGGELFLASLSLAFGLAEVVQSFSGGVRLDSIFIDEGFGTLDSETLEAAMKALAEVQAEGRLVGIISHVGELKSRIPARIEVFPGEDGSRLLVRGV